MEKTQVDDNNIYTNVKNKNIDNYSKKLNKIIIGCSHIDRRLIL